MKLAAPKARPCRERIESETAEEGVDCVMANRIGRKPRLRAPPDRLLVDEWRRGNYLNSDIVIVGDGGQITLKLSDAVLSAPGPEIGVFVNNGLIDVDYPHGQNANPAGFFSSPPQAH